MPWLFTIRYFTPRYSFIPESIKWQISNNRVAEAMLSIKKIAHINDISISDEKLKHLNIEKYMNDTSESFYDIFKYKRFFWIFTSTTFIFFCLNIVYTGAIAFAAISTDNPYMMLTINSIIDAVAAIAGNFANEILGRKYATMIPCVISGVLYPISAFINDDQVILLMLFMTIGRLFLTIGFNAQYLYAAELYPTNIRARAYAARLAIGSLGNILAPQVRYPDIYVHLKFMIGPLGCCTWSVSFCYTFGNIRGRINNSICNYDFPSRI